MRQGGVVGSRTFQTFVGCDTLSVVAGDRCAPGVGQGRSMSLCAVANGQGEIVTDWRQVLSDHNREEKGVVDK